MHYAVGMNDLETDFTIITVIAVQIFLKLFFCIVVVHA